MASNPEPDAPGTGDFTEVGAAALREVSSGLRKFVEEIKMRKLPTIRLNDASWLDDHNGVVRHLTVHGFLLSKSKYPELYAAVRALLKIAEIEAERVELYATTEDGITIHVEEDISNEYGRELGTDHGNLPLSFIIQEAKEKTKNYNYEKLKEALQHLLESLEGGRE
jgi:hypothetical protein